MTSSSPDILLETRGLSRQFGGFYAVRDVNLAVRRGEIHALIGPNGAGKTTFFNLLTKFLQPSAGSIHYRGEDITRIKAADIAGRGMIRSFQISAVFGRMSVLENVRLALQQPAGVSYHFWRSSEWLDRLNGRAMALLEDFDLIADWETPAGELPYGRKRALEIATTLALEPELLLLDEPMAGLGQEDIARISDLIRTAARSRTVLMVEHNLSVVESLSDRITVLAHGEILAEGRYSDIAANPAVIEAYIGAGHE